MIIYYSVYLLVIIVGIAIFHKAFTHNRIRLFAGIAAVLMIVPEAFRSSNIGEDTLAYISWFERYYTSGWKATLFEGNPDEEIGYRVLNLIISIFTHHEQGLIIVTSILIIALHLFFLMHNSRHLPISILLFFACNHFLTSMCSLRQYIAMGIVWWFVPFMIKKNYKAAFGVTLIGFLFHKTSLVFVIASSVAYYLSNHWYNIGLSLGLELLSIPCINAIIPIFLTFLPKYGIYFANIENESLGVGKLRYIYIIIEVFILIMIMSKAKLHSKENIFLGILLTLSIYIGLLGKYIPHIFRLGYFFDYTLLLLVPQILPQKPRNRKLVELGLLLLSAVFFSYYLFTNAATTVPYEFFWS